MPAFYKNVPSGFGRAELMPLPEARSVVGRSSRGDFVRNLEGQRLSLRKSTIIMLPEDFQGNFVQTRPTRNLTRPVPGNRPWRTLGQGRLEEEMMEGDWPFGGSLINPAGPRLRKIA